MKNQYFGDINDYRNYGVLRTFASAGLRLGIVWMMTPGDGRSDGSLIGYLEKERQRRHDPELFDFLRAWRNGGGERDVRVIETSGLLGDARFFGDIVPGEAPAREEWFREAMQRVRASDVVFFDPDNGLPARSVTGRNRPKYLLWPELAAAYRAGHSVVVYQHYWREARARILERRFGEMERELGTGELFAIGSSQVGFFIAAQARHRAAVGVALDEIAKRWGGQLNVHRMPEPAQSAKGQTTAPSYLNRNHQIVVRKTDLPGNDHCQWTYVLRCGHCEGEYGANGSDIFRRKCPVCQGRAAGLAIG